MRATVRLLIAAALSATVAGDVAANGREVQREIVARVVSVDARAGTLVVERELRGSVWRLTLRIAPGTPIFACSRPPAALTELRTGDAVSVYYEPVGREGLANLVVVEPPK
jgi:hypothetical protein